MSQEPLKPFKGSLKTYKKVCVIENGIITSMFWEHPAGNDEIDLNEVLSRWHVLYPDADTEDFSDQRFLSAHGFTMQNVVRDGVRMNA